MDGMVLAAAQRIDALMKEEGLDFDKLLGPLGPIAADVAYIVGYAMGQARILRDEEAAKRLQERRARGLPDV